MSTEDLFLRLLGLSQVQNHLARFGGFPSESVLFLFDSWQWLRHFANNEYRRRRQPFLERQFLEGGPMDLLFRESGIRHDYTRRRSIQSARHQFRGDRGVIFPWHVHRVSRIPQLCVIPFRRYVSRAVVAQKDKFGRIPPV